MLLERFYDDNLAQASYLIGCAATGEAIVIDPSRDAEQYLRAASAEGLRVTHVTETHIHADFVSGTRELAARTGARMFLSGEGGADWQYVFASDPRATILHDGDSITVGNIRLDVLHTPGHTPEHITFLVTDTPATDRPMGAITGDFIFVGDVGRPDLLEKAAKVAGTMRDSARSLYHSLQRFKQLPDYLQLWPGHGAGSACGKALGAVPSTTLGYERIANWALMATSEEEFIETVLAGQPEPPRYFAEMKRINREGPRLLGGARLPEKLPPSRLEELLATDALIVDTRSASEFAAGHVPGTINIPLNRSFSTWAGSLLPYDRELHLIVEQSCRRCAEDAVRALAMIGLDRVAGYFTSDVLQEMTRRGRSVATLPRVSVADVAAQLERGEVTVIDVRANSEWTAGHLPDVGNIPLGQLPDHVAAIPRDRPVVMQCQSGARSAIAASVLRARGLSNAVTMAGGFAEWERAGYPVQHEP